ncbi:hypothetical protein [Luteimonas sp. MC1825]|uniref:hypothetical protein n=1 Tax=Luteimonas sp. MC1825 TaxID=2761107 RepID=UPI00161FB9D9|nr:hypothetical protein [Luteimonas sp. MC1825]MBB6599243.1 hypothetical protein [Luteimonas sp. MC1825]QOC89358.1 hypothetical protein IDM46_06525 [Luteimonas sp. MC1825]
MKLASTFAALTLAVAATYSVPATAQTSHANASQPAARCQGALPAFETAIRKRPLAIQNEGNASSYITCGFEFDAGAAIDNSAILLDTYFTNTTTAPVSLTCTAVTGWQTGANEFVSRTEVIAPGAQSEDMFWYADDFVGGGMASGLVAISCNLPVGVGINDTYIFWDTADAPV